MYGGDYCGVLFFRRTSHAWCSVGGSVAVITGHNFGVSAGASVDILVGNPEDTSVSVRVPATPVFPPGDDGRPKVCTRAVKKYVFISRMCE